MDCAAAGFGSHDWADSKGKVVPSFDTKCFSSLQIMTVLQEIEKLEASCTFALHCGTLWHNAITCLRRFSKGMLKDKVLCCRLDVHVEWTSWTNVWPSTVAALLWACWTFRLLSVAKPSVSKRYPIGEENRENMGKPSFCCQTVLCGSPCNEGY